MRSGFPNIFSAYKSFFSSYLSIESVLERLVLKNAADCTSQRLKRTSGARVMTFLCLTSIGTCLFFFVFGRYELVVGTCMY